MGRSIEESPVFFITSVCFAFYMIFYQYTPFLWYLLNSFSISLSGWVTYLTRKEVLFSVTFSGMHLTILFAIFIVISHIFSDRRKSWWRIPIFLLFLIFTNIIYIAFYVYLPVFLDHLWLLVKERAFSFVPQPPAPLPDRYVVVIPLMAFAFLLIPIAVYLRNMEFHGAIIAMKKKGILFALAAAVFIAFSVGTLMITMPFESFIGKEVVFYEEGFLNWNSPTFGDYGSLSSGMFGNLPKFVELMGLKSRRISKITSNSLKGAKILVMINIDEEVKQSEIDSIWKFVDAGGSLLLLGDHTFWGKDRKSWLNEILKPVNIEYNFDSADYFIGGWLHSYFYAKHPITYYLGDQENDPGIVVGASLKTSYPAAPIIYGRYGFSDEGNPYTSESGGYLGNLKYDTSEQLGDLVLAAEQQYGKGKVLVFGDTSGFANTILMNTIPFINRVFAWLSSDKDCRSYLIRFIFSVVFLIAAIMLMAKSGNGVMSLAICIPIVLFLAILTPLVGSWEMEQPLNGNIAYIDSSHFERYSMESWREDGVMGLYLNLMRNGYFPMQLHNFDRDKIFSSKLLFLLSPSKKFTKGEVKMLKSYVENGGILFLTVGWEERKASMPLLEAFNFRPDPTPLGYFKVNVPNTDQHVMYYEAWPIYSDDEDVEIISNYNEYSLISMKRYGKGKFVYIGDTYFFFNKNLELEDNYYEDNINFFKWLLERLKRE
jgi:hypothetical protein